MKRYSYFFLTLFLNMLPCSAQSTHPRLLFGSSELTGLWNKITANPAFLQRYYNDLRDNANFNRLTAFYNSRLTMHYASDMALVYLIDLNYTNRNAFKDAAINSLVSANSMYNHANLNRNDGLTLSSAVIHMSLVYDMLYSQLSAAQKKDAATKIKDLVDELLNDYYNSSFTQIQTLYGNNHLMHRAAAIGIDVIAIPLKEIRGQKGYILT